MKKIIKEILIYLLMKVDEQELKHMEFNVEAKINLKKYIPKDGKWHHIGTTIMAWVKRDKDGNDVSYDELAVYSEGKKSDEMVKLCKNGVKIKDKDLHGYWRFEDDMSV